MNGEIETLKIILLAMLITLGFVIAAYLTEPDHDEHLHSDFIQE